MPELIIISEQILPWVVLIFVIALVAMLVHRIILYFQPKVKSQKIERYTVMNNWDINSPIVETYVPPAPDPPSAKWIFYLIGLACFVFPPLAIVAPNPSVVSAGVYLIFIWIGVKVFKLGQDADQQHAQNMASRAAAQRSHADYVRAQIETANAQREAQRQAHIKFYEDNARLEAIEAQRRAAIQQQRNINHLEHFRQTAFEVGVDIQSLVEVNRQGLLDEQEVKKRAKLDRLDTQKQTEEIKVQLDAGDRLELAEADQIDLLRDKLEKVLAKLYEVEGSQEFTPAHKERLIQRYEKDVEYLEAKIDDIQARLLSSKNGQKAERAKAAAADGRASYPPQAGDDEDEV